MILYMEDGDIKEARNHEELMRKNRKYAALYNSRFAYKAAPRILKQGDCNGRAHLV